MGITTIPMGHGLVQVHTSPTCTRVVPGHTSMRMLLELSTGRSPSENAGKAASLHPLCSFSPSRAMLAQLPASGESRLHPPRHLEYLWEWREKGKRIYAHVPSLGTQTDSQWWPQWSSHPVATPHSQKPGQAIKRPREGRLQGHGDYYDGVYFLLS